MIYNRTTIKEIIAKVLADNDIQEDTTRLYDMYAWAFEAMERIGAFPELDIKVAGKGGEPLLEVANYQAELPTGLHSIIQVAFARSYDGPFYPMRQTSGSFDPVREFTTVDDSDPLNPVYGTKEEVENVMSFETDFVYTLTPGYIKMNQQEGYLLLSYRTIPTDEDGYPYIPDDPGFHDAIYWYITMKLLYPKWAMGQVRDSVYFNARQSWNFYSKQAYGNSLMPDADGLETIKNTWLRLVPEINDNNNFFSATGQAQVIHNQTNRNYARIV